MCVCVCVCVCVRSPISFSNMCFAGCRLAVHQFPRLLLGPLSMSAVRVRHQPSWQQATLPSTRYVGYTQIILSDAKEYSYKEFYPRRCTQAVKSIAVARRYLEDDEVQNCVLVGMLLSTNTRINYFDAVIQLQPTCANTCHRTMLILKCSRDLKTEARC